jgi:hypothetical protein
MYFVTHWVIAAGGYKTPLEMQLELENLINKAA